MHASHNVADALPMAAHVILPATSRLLQVNNKADRWIITPKITYGTEAQLKQYQFYRDTQISHTQKVASLNKDSPIMQLSGYKSRPFDHSSSRTTEKLTDDKCQDDALLWTSRENDSFVDTIAQLKDFLDNTLDHVRKSKQGANFGIDMEGYNLGKEGLASLLQISIFSENHTWIFDVYKLDYELFDTNSKMGWSIARLLEGETRTLWWDLRNDQNCLFHHFGIVLHPWSTVDLQLYELNTRDSDSERPMTRRAGLVDVVGPELVKSGKFTLERANQWTAVKRTGSIELRKSDYRVFLDRPLPAIAIKYAGGDTIFLRILLEAYEARLESGAKLPMERIQAETARSLAETCTEEYNQYGKYPGQHARSPGMFH